MSNGDLPEKRRAGQASLAEEGPPLAGVDGLVEGTVGELSRLLDTKQVVGAPIVLGDATLIPLVSMGFAFGAGGGGGTGKDGRGGGGGGAGGGGVKPVAVIVIDAQGVRLEPIPEEPSGLGKLGIALAEALQRRSGSGREDGGD